MDKVELVAYMQDHTIEGQPRTVRRYRMYDTCPLPTIADKLLFMRELSLARMGFQGFILDGVTIFQPKKKTPGGELTSPEKAANRAISSIRIRIEHAIGGVKRYRMVKDKIRLLKDGIRDTIMETCSGLHNFRLQYRPWNYTN
jgi:hypothetical protein